MSQDSITRSPGYTVIGKRETVSSVHSWCYLPLFLIHSTVVNNSKLTCVLSNPLRALILGSTGETGSKCFACHHRRNVPTLHLPSLLPSLFYFCIFFPVFYLQMPAPPQSPPHHTHTFPPGDIKGVESKTKTPTHPHRAVRCLRLDVHRAEVRVQHLIPSELLQVFVDSQGLEVCIWVVFIISRCTQQQETTFWLYEVPTGVTYNDVSHAK